MKYVLMYDKRFNEMNDINHKDTMYITVRDVDKFKEMCRDRSVYDDGVDSRGHYEWQTYEDEWTRIDDAAVLEALDELQERYEKSIGGITQSKADTERKWNIEIVIDKQDTGTIIQTNSEPISMKEVHEAIDVMLKPSFFGKHLTEIRIYTDTGTES